MRDFKIYIGIVIIAELALGCVHPQRERENKPPEITSTSDYTILPLSDTIVAVIDEEKIRKKDIDAAYREYLISLNEEDTEETRHRFMEDFIQRELVIRYARDSGVEKRDAFSSQLKRAKKNLMYEMGTALLISTITVTDDEVRVYYQEHLEEFTEPEKIEVRHILTNTKEEAEIALERIRKGDLFAVVAAQMSVHASGKTGGDLPPFSRGLYHGSFEDIAFDLKVGEMSEVVKTQLGYHIIQKTREFPSRVISFRSVTQKIHDTLVEKKRTHHLKQMIDLLSEHYRLKVNESWVFSE